MHIYKNVLESCFERARENVRLCILWILCAIFRFVFGFRTVTFGSNAYGKKKYVFVSIFFYLFVLFSDIWSLLCVSVCVCVCLKKLSVQNLFDFHRKIKSFASTLLGSVRKAATIWNVVRYVLRVLRVLRVLSLCSFSVFLFFFSLFLR